MARKVQFSTTAILLPIVIAVIALIIFAGSMRWSYLRSRCQPTDAILSWRDGGCYRRYVEDVPVDHARDAKVAARLKAILAPLPENGTGNVGN